ncbi:hypothetical protein DTO271G3_2523 [Paecilomyces variotii]|nr:hypothetical protein DTO271G3_2523 [Paecilomyces variotii]
MPTQKAIIITSPGHATLTTTHPIPHPHDDFILIKTIAVALNPTDWKHIDFISPPSTIVGCDFAGIIEEIGPSVPSGKGFKKGDRVFGVTHGADAYNKENGAFAEHILAKGGLVNKVPENLSLEDASTLTLGLGTVCHGLYMALGLRRPEEKLRGEKEEEEGKKKYVLVYGGSTATGSLGIQFLKLSGYIPITTCSPKNFSFVKSLGAIAAFDYHDPDAGKKIREYTNNSLTIVWDTIAQPDSAALCAEALTSASGGKYYTILPQKSPREDVESGSTLMYALMGEPFYWGGELQQVKKEDYEYLAEFLESATKLVAEGKVKPHPAKVGKDGLKGVLEGLQLMRENKVSGVKLVYRVEETP